MDKKILYFAAGVWAFTVFSLSCANMGMPSGGAKDTIPPVVLRSIPEMLQTNYTESEIKIYFDEFVTVEGLREKLTISPPTEGTPTHKIRGKSLIIDLKDELADSTTYSLDFGDAIVDNNERNPLLNYRLAFSTGLEIDTLEIIGFVVSAFNLEPIENALIMLYTSPEDTMVYTSIPNYIARTDADGFFRATNLADKKYQIFALSDMNNDMIFTPGLESIAFLDSLVAPHTPFLYEPDTIATEYSGDSLMNYEDDILDKLVHLLHFEEEFFDLRLEEYERPERKHVNFTFTESVKDTFNVEILNIEPEGEWKYIETSSEFDSIRVWLTDSVVYKRDSLILQVTYQQPDSAGIYHAENDTVKLYFSDTPLKERGRREKNRRQIEQKELFVDLLNDIKATEFDVYSDINIESPEPIAVFDSSKVHLFLKEDTLLHSVDFSIALHETNKRKFTISHNWDFKSSYKLEIDSGAVTTIYGLPSTLLQSEFTIQDEEHYGKIVLNIQNVSTPLILQLLTDNEEESVVQEKRVYIDGEAELPYINPGKYIIKVIFDKNDNGVWDTGNLKEKKMPEEVLYFPEVIRVRSNWEQKPTWILPHKKQFKKDITDKDASEEQENQRGQRR